MTTSPRTPAADVHDPFAGGDLELTCAASESQKEIWTAARLGDDASCAFNESVSLRLGGALDRDALWRAWARLAERHEALRTTFSPDGEWLCVARVANHAPRQVDLSTLPDAEQPAALRALCKKEVETPFNLEFGPLFRPVLVELSAEDHALVLTAHHIVCDGWSTGVLLKDLGSLYSAELTRQPVALPPAHRFSDYARRFAESDHSETLEYWAGRYEGAIPMLDLPTDRPRPPLRSFDAAREDFTIEAALVAGLKKLAAAEKTSLFTVVFTGFAAFVSRLTGARDLPIGIPTAGQSALGMASLVGHCVNLLPVRVALDPAQPFRALLAQTRTTLLDAFDHQEYTFGTLLRQLHVPRDPSRIPLVPVQFNLDPPSDPAAYPFKGLSVGLTTNPRSYENFEWFVNIAERGGRLEIECQYNRNLFDGATLRARLAELRALLEGVVADPGTPVARLPILDAAQRRTVLESWNATERARDASRTASQLIAETARRSPDRPAVESGGEVASYAALEARAGALAALLVERGVAEDDLVGLALTRSVDMVVAALAIWKTGAAYVPLDPKFPRDRLAYMLEDAGIRTLVTESSLAGVLPPSAAQPVVMDREALGAVAAPPDRARPDGRAYVIYTSGSTGKPKGVQVPHRAVANFLHSMAREPGLGADDALVAVTTLSFDIAVLELYLPLVVGARAVVATEDEVGDGRLLKALLAASGAKVMQATPVTWRMLIDAGWDGGEGFTALCGGEAFPADLVAPLRGRVGRLYNMYGPTETTVWSALHPVTTDEHPVPIGKPIDNTRCYVLDAEMQPVPIGVPGELLIGGEGVTLGYLDRAELTAERFVADPFRPGQTLYRTGDLVRHRRDGALVFDRRLDTQVKVRGFRIELGEIEAALARHDSVAEVVCNVYEPTPGDTRLAAYCVPRGKALAEAGELRRFLGETLPAYMVPQHFVELAAIPLTPNRKADRKALPPPVQTVRVYRAPAGDAETQLAGVWAEVLGVERVGADDDFFDLGGHSILATRVIARLAELCGIDLPLRRIFANPRLEDLARHVSLLLTLKAQVVTVDDGGEREETSF
jgi:amino acid adenylation domain-containing protein